jgi:hypothetical protein
MNTVELIQYSLATAFELLGEVTADLSQEQADWKPPGKASSIGSIYSHLITYVDFLLEKIFIPFDDTEFRKPPPPQIIMQDVQGELSDLHKRTGEVQKAYHDWLSSLTPADMDAEIETSVGPLNVGQTLEFYIVWHINVHCGEIAALKGCQGGKGYPW